MCLPSRRKGCCDPDPAAYNKGLLDLPGEPLWGFIEPLELEVLRETLGLWGRQASANADFQGVVEDVLLMLDPELICDAFGRTKNSSAVTALPTSLGPWMPMSLLSSARGYPSTWMTRPALVSATPSLAARPCLLPSGKQRM